MTTNLTATLLELRVPLHRLAFLDWSRPCQSSYGASKCRKRRKKKQTWHENVFCHIPFRFNAFSKILP